MIGPILARVGRTVSDGLAFGLGSMTDRQWKLFYDTMRSEGLYPPGLDYKKAFDLRFVRATLQKFQ